MLPELTKLNQHAIKLQDNKQSSYIFIYSLGSVKLKIHKTYIKTNLANGLIWLLKLPANTPILFLRKPNGSF